METYRNKRLKTLGVLSSKSTDSKKILKNNFFKGKPNIMTYTLSNEQLVGFFEGDGGIQIRVDKTQNSFTFRPFFSFSQKKENQEILYWIKHMLNSEMLINDQNLTNSKTLAIQFNSNSGQQFIKILKNTRLLNPGTYLDYLIALEIYQYNITQTLDLKPFFLEKLENQPKKEKTRLKKIALLLLRYARPAQSKKRNTNSITQYLDYINATLEEIQEANLYFNEMLSKLLVKQNKLISDLDNNNIEISNDYLVYYYVADGSFFFEFTKETLSSGEKQIKVTPRWTLSDDNFARPLLKRVKRQLGDVGQYQKVGNNSGFLRIRGFKNIQTYVLPLFENKVVPSFRKKQLEKYLEICELYRFLSLKKDLNSYYTFIRNAYFFNPNSTKRSEQIFEKKYLPLIKSFIERNQLK